MSRNYFERHALGCGYSVVRIEPDYGIDLVLATYDDTGEVENGQIFIQLKATDQPKTRTGSGHLAIQLKRTDLDHWLNEPLPVILVLYDATRETAYWLYLQAHFEAIAGFDLNTIGNTITVHVPLANILDVDAIRQFARFRDAVMAQLGGRIQHHV
jgi:hypothetical protein